MGLVVFEGGAGSFSLHDLLWKFRNFYSSGEDDSAQTPT